MPELPEVETIRRQIETHLVGQTLTSITINRERIFHGDPDIFLSSSILSARRFGKLLVLDFSNSHSLCIHLKMTGRLSFLTDPSHTPPPHTHVVFHLGIHRLSFSDYRRFGYLQSLPTSTLTALPFIHKLGPEPLKDLTLAAFIALCSTSKRPIKNLLLDQHKLAGIGNIYACDSLWLAKLSPFRPASSLTKSELKRLYQAILDALSEGIARGGASDNAYYDLLGQKGKYQDFFKVYNREGKPCQRCSTPILRTKLAGRGTFYCPKCQQ